MELQDTEVCSLHSHITGTNVRLPKIHNQILPGVYSEPSGSPAKCESSNNPSLLLCRVSHMTKLIVISRVMRVRNQRAKRLSQTRVHIVTDLASLFTDQRMSGLPILAKYKHFKKNLWAHFGHFSNRPQFFFLEVTVVQTWS